VFAGQPGPASFASADWTADENWEWASALFDPPDELRQLYRDTIVRSDAIIADADLEDVAKGSSSFAGQPTLHWILLHVTTETARYAGHADLIREAVDGRVGWRGNVDIWPSHRGRRAATRDERRGRGQRVTTTRIV